MLLSVTYCIEYVFQTIRCVNMGVSIILKPALQVVEVPAN